MNRKMNVARTANSFSKLALHSRLKVSLGLALLVFCFTVQTNAQNTISSIAGGGTNSGAATSAYLPGVASAVRDTHGNTYISVTSLNFIYKVNASGTISVYAGTGIFGFSGDGGPATLATLDRPQGLAIDSSGNLFVVDSFNYRVRRIDAVTGTISTVAGSGAYPGGYAGDSGAATSALLNLPEAVAVDSSGNLFIADTGNNVIRKVDNSAEHIITTYAGNGTQGIAGKSNGDGGPAAAAQLNVPYGVAVDSSGNVFIADTTDSVVRKVDTSSTHVITTYAGSPATVYTFGGDGGPANAAGLSNPHGVFVDALDNLFIADTSNNRIRKVDNSTEHIISTIAGSGTACSVSGSGCGDGGTATSALLNAPTATFEDGSGALVIVDAGDQRVRLVAAGATPAISNFAGGGSDGDGGPALKAIVDALIVDVDSSGNVFVLDPAGLRVRRVDATTNTITTYAGTGVQGVYGSLNGNNVPSTQGSFVAPQGMTIDSSGNLYVADTYDYAVRRIDATTQIITTVAGNGINCFGANSPTCGDGAVATSANLTPAGVAKDSAGNIYIADITANRIRRVDATTGIISNFAGTGAQGYAGDSGPATAATMRSPFGMTLDSEGNLYFVDSGNSVIRKIDTTTEHTITTVAFNGEPTFGGDGGPALSASMNGPDEVAVDSRGNIFVGGGFDNVVQRIDAVSQTVVTVAGDVNNLDGGFSGDGGPATKALLGNFGLAVDASHNLFIADDFHVRKVHMTPVASVTAALVPFATTVAGNIGNTQIVSITNTGLDDLNITSVSVTANFILGNECGVAVAPAANCSVDVTFNPAPGVAGTVSGTLTISTNDPSNPTLSYALLGVAVNTGFTLTVALASGETGTGTVVSSVGEIECPLTACSELYGSGDVVVLSAFADAGSVFTGWTGPCTLTTVFEGLEQCSVTMSAAETVTAKFSSPPTVTVSVATNGLGTGTVTSIPAGISCPGTCTAAFPAGTSLKLTAAPAAGSVFKGWTSNFCTVSATGACNLVVTGGSDLLASAGQLLTAVFGGAPQPFVRGQVFVGTSSNMIYVYSPNGTLVQILSGSYNSCQIVGMTFDANGNLFATNTGCNTAEIYAKNGTGPSVLGSGGTQSSSVVIDPFGTIFVGQDDATNATVLKFAGATSPTPTATFYPATENFGTAWIELLDDEHTLLYTSASQSVKSFDLLNSLQNPDFAVGLPGQAAYALRELPDKTILVANVDRIVRLNTSGAVIQTYLPPATTTGILYGLNLDPDLVTFWAGDFVGGIVYRFNIATGAIVSQFPTGLGFSYATDLGGISGIAIFGQPASGGADLAISASAPSSAARGTLFTYTITATNNGPLAAPGVTITDSLPGGMSASSLTGPCIGTTTIVCSIGTLASGASSTVKIGVTPSAGGSLTNMASVTSGQPDPNLTNNTASASTTITGTVSETLTVTKNGTGSGTVTSAPAGINCGATCSATFTSGTVVVLAATETSGSTFSGWSGACTNITGTCSVTMNETQAVTATFTTASASGSPGPFAYVPIFSTGNVSVFDVTTNLQVATIPVGGGPVDAAVSPNGSFVYVTSFGGGYVSVISAATNTVVATIPVGSLPFGLAVTPDSSTIYVAVGGTGTNFVSVISAATNSVVATVPVQISPGFVAVTPDGSRAYVANGGSASVSVISVATNTVIATIPVGQSPQAITATPDGKTVYVVCPSSGSVSVISTASNTVVQTIPVSNGPLGISITPDGTTAFVGEINGAATAIINLATNSVVATIPVGTSPRGSAITPDGTAVWQSNLNSTFVSVISTASDAVTASVPVGGSAYNVAIGPGAPTTQTITQPLSPTAPNQFNFGPHSFAVQYPAGATFSGVNMTVAAVEISQAAFARRVASTTFSASRCLVYSGAGGNCVDYEVTCTNSSGTSITCPSETTPTIAVKTSFGTAQQVTNPGFLTTPIGTNAWQNIFSGFELQRIDPTMKGRTSGFSEFVAVDLGATNTQGAATFQFEAPLLASNPRSFISGTTVPVQFQLTSVAHAGVSVTDATAGISMLMVADVHGNPVSNIVLEQAGAFAYQTSTQGYLYSLNTFGYAAGVYNITVYGNAFAAQQVQITLLPTVVSSVLTVAKTGSGSGMVTSSPAGINCGTTCTAGYPAGTVVTLTATQAAGSTFSGWSGACTNAAGTCSVTMSASQSATATFTAALSTGSPGPFAYLNPFSTGDISVYDATSYLPVSTIPGTTGMYPIAQSPDGSVVYATSVGADTVSFIDTKTNTVTATVPVGATPFSASITPNNATLYVLNTNGSSVSVVSTANHNVVATISLSTPNPVNSVVSQDGKTLYVTHDPQAAVTQINTASNTVTRTITVGPDPYGIAISPDGKTLYVTNNAGLDFIDTASGVVTQFISIPNQPWQVSVSPDGTKAYVGELNGSATAIVDTITKTVVATVGVQPMPWRSASTPDGSLVWQANLGTSTTSIFSANSNTVVATIPFGGGGGVLILPAPPTTQTITQPLSPSAPNQFNFGPHSFTVQYPVGASFSGVNMTVAAVQMSQAAFARRVASTTFSAASCLVYSGAGGNCVDYEVTCTNSSGASITCPSETTPTIAVKTSFGTAQMVTNPGFLTTPIGTNAWQNIFSGFELQQIDPTMKGRTTGFSEFVAVDLGVTNAQGLGQLQLQAPLLASEPRSFVTGTAIPVQFQLTSVAHPGQPVTDASAGISVVLLTDANGNALNTLVLEQGTAFAYQSATQNYQYSLNTSGYAAGTYGVTVFGNAFVAQQVQFALTSTPVINLVTTLQSLTLNAATNQYVATVSVSNAGNATANIVTITAAGLNGTATATKLPLSIGNVVPGTSVAATVVFPASAGAPGSRGELTISETYTGGSAGSGLRVTLP
jgi:YVTN family beta-propeller protein